MASADVWQARATTLAAMLRWPLQHGWRGAFNRWRTVWSLFRKGSDLYSYQNRYPDVGTLHPYAHYAATGQFEGRVFSGAVSSWPAPPNRPWKGRLSDALAAAAVVPKAAAPDSRIGETDNSVDLIIPFYNRRDLVLRAAKSAIDQTHQELRVIAVDDGSADGGGEVLKKEFHTEIESGRLAVLRQRNAGAPAARNTGIASGVGAWVAYLDSDNALDNYHVETLLSAVKEAKALMVYSGWREPGGVRHEAQCYDRRRLLEANYIDLNTFLHHRSLYQAYGGFDERLARFQDWDLVMRYGRVTAPAVADQESVERAIGADRISVRIPAGPSLRQVRQNHIAELVAAGLAPRAVAGSQAALAGDEDALRALDISVAFIEPADVPDLHRRGDRGGFVWLLTRKEASAISVLARQTPYFAMTIDDGGALDSRFLNVVGSAEEARQAPVGWAIGPTTNHIGTD